MTQIREQLQETLGTGYALERELGGGGMSRVFVARDTTLDRQVVVKVLSSELAATVSTERFTREIKVAASLQQANIVPVLAAGATTDGLPYYTMPLVEGQSLRSRLASGAPLPINEILFIVRDVAKALVYAHDRGIVHRDIKPDNVLLSGGTAVVTDFGIAKALTAARTDAGTGSTLTQFGTAIGTPAYMAPEQAAGDPAVDHRADLYSLGCLTYELLTSQSPFHGRTPARMMAAHMGETPAPVTSLRPNAPPALAELVARCLAKDPEARPQAASEVVQAIDAVTSSGSIQGLPSILIGGPAMLKKALLLYAAAFVVVAVLAEAAIIVIGLPGWVLPGALIVMALGLPVILFTAYVYSINRRLATQTPTFTPGGTPSVAHGTMATIALKATPHVSWRRTAIAGISALGVFTLLVGGFMVLRALGIGPAGSLLAAGQVSSQDWLVVTDFKVTNTDSSLGRVLGDATRTTLAESKVIRLPSPSMIADALRRMRQPPSATLTFDITREMALRNNIKAIVDGEITGLGAGGFIVTLKLVRTDSLRELASFRESAADARELITAVDKLSRRLRERFGESLRSVRATTFLEDATTSSMEALRKYTDGRRANLEGDAYRSIQYLREAVAIDSTFAAAWRALAIALSNAGRPQSGIDSALAQAYRYSGRLGEYERDLVHAAYFINGPGRDRAKGVAVYEQMLARGDSSWGNNLGLMLVQRRQYARAETVYRATERRCPGCLVYLYANLADALLYLGKVDEADSVIRSARGRSTGLRLMPLTVLYMRGDTGGYRRAVDSAVARDDSLDRWFTRPMQRLLRLRDGRVAEFRRLEAADRDTARATPLQRLNWVVEWGNTVVTVRIEGRAELLVRQLDAALSKMNLAQVPEADRPYRAIVAAYARAGRPDKARAWLERFETDIKDTALRRDLTQERAQALATILEAEGKYDAAAREFRKGDVKPDGPTFDCDICLQLNLAGVFDKAGQTDSAIANYERAIGRYSYSRVTRDWYVLAPYSRRLGELYEQRGDVTRAAKYYLDFVNLWRNADPELQPQVAEIRRRLSRLADREGR